MRSHSSSDPSHHTTRSGMVSSADLAHPGQQSIVLGRRLHRSLARSRSHVSSLHAGAGPGECCAHPGRRSPGVHGGNVECRRYRRRREFRTAGRCRSTHKTDQVIDSVALQTVTGRNASPTRSPVIPVTGPLTRPSSSSGWPAAARESRAQFRAWIPSGSAPPASRSAASPASAVSAARWMNGPKETRATPSSASRACGSEPGHVDHADPAFADALDQRADRAARRAGRARTRRPRRRRGRPGRARSHRPAPRPGPGRRPRRKASVRAFSTNGTPSASPASTAARTAATASGSGRIWSSRLAPTTPDADRLADRLARVAVARLQVGGDRQVDRRGDPPAPCRSSRSTGYVLAVRVPQGGRDGVAGRRDGPAPGSGRRPPSRTRRPRR